MLTLALMLFLQTAAVAKGEILGPYSFREEKDQTTKVVLKNGLTVLVREQPAVPLASITTHVKAGYFDEEDRVTGIAHVIEHMFFKGTARRAVGEIAKETKTLGGYLNAYTYYDRTVYYTVVPAENALKALDIQADALLHSSFDADELRREIEVVLQENSRKLDNPPAVASEKLYATAYQEHRMKRWRIGTPEGLRALTRDDVTAFYDTYYSPSNIILTVVGDVDREQVLNEIVKLYGDAPARDPIARDNGNMEPAQTETRFAWERGPIAQTSVALGFHASGILSEDARALEVLASILGSGRSSVLIQRLRDEKSLITDGSAALVAFRDLGFFEIDVRTGRPAEAQTAILAELEGIKRNGVTAEALARAKAGLAQEFLQRFETVDGVGDEIAYWEALGDWQKSNEYLAAIQRVTPQQVLDAARKYFSLDKLSAFEYRPDAGGSQEDYRSEVLAKVEDSVAVRKEAELPVKVQIPQMGGGIANSVTGTIQRRSILRGPDVYILDDRRLPIVSFGIFYPGGRLYETEGNSGITELMLRAALRGTTQLDSAGIARRFENAGARIQVVNEPDFFGYILNGMPGQMDEALTVLMDVLQRPKFDEQQIQMEKALQIQRIRNLRDDNYAYPVSLFMKTLFGGEAYARPAVGTEEGIAKLTNVDLQEWFRNNERKLKPTIVIVGDARGTALIAPITDALTNEDLEPRDLSVLPRIQPAFEKGELAESVSRQQTALVYGFAGAPRGTPDRYALEILGNVVSGLGGRFFDAIRDKQGLAYTVRTANIFNAKGGAVFTYTAFSPEKEDQVRAALAAEHEKLRADGVTQEELAKAIAYSVGERDIALQTRQSQVLEYARAVYTGAGIASVATYRDSIREVTRERVKAAIDRYLDPNTLRVGVVRGGAKP